MPWKFFENCLGIFRVRRRERRREREWSFGIGNDCRDTFIMGTVKSFESRWVHKVGLSYRSVQVAGIKVSVTPADGGE